MPRTSQDENDSATAYRAKGTSFWDDKAFECMSVRFYNKQIDGFECEKESYEIFRKDSTDLDDDERLKCMNPQDPMKNTLPGHQEISIEAGIHS